MKPYGVARLDFFAIDQTNSIKTSYHIIQKSIKLFKS